MPTKAVRGMFLGVALAMLACPTSAQQQAPLNLNVPPPPPPELVFLSQLPLPDSAGIALMPTVWPRVTGAAVLPAGTRLDVVLASPMSTRITRTGDRVEFRTTEELSLDNNLVLPPETIFSGRVVRAQKPGGFGRRGSIEVQVERLELRGTEQRVAAHLQSADPAATGDGPSDGSRTADIFELAQWTLLGTMIGGEVKGGKGAAIGAGAAAAIAAILLSSRRGPDLYIEPGTPFTILLEDDVRLPAEEVYAAQVAYRQSAAGRVPSPSVSDSTDISEDPDDATLDPARPKLKRRPKPARP